LLMKYIKSVLWRVAKRLSYIEDARCLKVKFFLCHSKVRLIAIWMFFNFLNQMMKFTLLLPFHIDVMNPHSSPDTQLCQLLELHEHFPSFSS